MAIPGKVRGVGGSYADGVEPLEIHVKRVEAEGLPFELGRRVAVTLAVRGQRYAAGLTAPRRRPGRS